MTGPADQDPAGGNGRRSYRIEVRSAAPLEQVWQLLGEARRWKDWSFLTGSDLERRGSPDADGIGAVRHLTVLGIGSREEVVAWDPPHHLGYIILSGFPVRNYRADVNLTSEGPGTLIIWSATFDEKFAGTGPLVTAVMTRLIGRFARQAARHAERIHAGTP